MKIKSLSIKNFRCYQEEVTVPFDDLTTIIGKNDIGKSTILHALEIFFNNDTVQIDQDDANKYADDKVVSITCEFTDVPDSIVLDATAITTLRDEYLLTSDETLKIRKTYNCSRSKPSEEVFIIANHPTANGVNDLLSMKEADLKKIIKEKSIAGTFRGNPSMRKAIWDSETDLKLQEVAVPVAKSKEDFKRIWDELSKYLPIFALFQSDRNSKDSDGEVQNPLKGAIATAIAEVQEYIDQIQEKVQEKATEIASLTHDALKTLDPNLAKTLKPQFTPPTVAKWTGLFSLGMNTDDGIPLNKRGSGVRRLVVISFFKAEAERKLKSSDKRNIIYAIEEPETAQHPNNQKILIEAFKELAETPNCQIVLTTHSPGLAAELPSRSIRFVSRDEAGNPVIQTDVDAFGPVAQTLGLIPDSRVKVLVCVEGPTDVTALQCLSHALHISDPAVPNLRDDERIAFIVTGGSTLKHWVNENYLRSLNIPEVHIYDNDVKTYSTAIESVNKRKNGSWGTLTKKHEIESYLHPDAISDAYGVSCLVVDHPDNTNPATPKAFALVYSAAKQFDGTMNDSKAKTYLSKAFEKMTVSRIQERDPDGEIKGWFNKISAMINQAAPAPFAPSPDAIVPHGGLEPTGD